MVSDSTKSQIVNLTCEGFFCFSGGFSCLARVVIWFEMLGLVRGVRGELARVMPGSRHFVVCLRNITIAGRSDGGRPTPVALCVVISRKDRILIRTGAELHCSRLSHSRLCRSQLDTAYDSLDIMKLSVSSCKEAEESLLSCTAQIMNQAVELLGSRSISDEAYTFESKIIAGSTPGKHFRHVLDHLRILVDAIYDWQVRVKHEPRSILHVDYDSRMASKLACVEMSVSASLREFQRTTERLYDVFRGSDGGLYHQSVRLCATTPFVVEMDSTVGRELWFCGLHAIHHYALARVILVRELDLKRIDDQFGVAPSTLVHREWRKESNRADVAHDAAFHRRQVEPDTHPQTSSSASRGALKRRSSGQSASQPDVSCGYDQQLKSKL